MKNSLKLFTLVAITGMVMISCEGPMGPQGEKGDKGDQGEPGSTLACAECHNTDDQIVAYSAQWSESMHATGGNAAYANRSGCVQCHTSQGFLEYVAEGSTAAISVPVNPLQINCFTCHNIHETYTDDDWALTKSGAQVLEVQYAGANVTWNYGNSNQCVFCHQARTASPSPVIGGSDVTLTSGGTRVGPHHGPVANLILGKTPYEFTGTAYPTTNVHTTNISNGCIKCHMSTPYGYQAGGHNMSMSYDSHGTETRLVTNCTPCHDISSSANITTFNNKIAAFQAEIQDKLDDLEGQLIASGVYNTTTELANAGTHQANELAAYLNYLYVKEDRSLGIHNPGYAEVLLDNSIAAMTTLGFPVTGK